MKVLLVDDHPLFLESMATLLAAHGLTVIGMASDGLEALEKARNLQPDVILMDICMSRCNGIFATRLIKAEMPQIKIVMLTASEEDDNLFEAIKSGACGYLLKKLQAKELLNLFSEIEKGQPPMAPGLALKVFKEFAQHQGENKESFSTEEKLTQSKITPRQTAILTLVAQGQSYRQVAETLFFSERTIKYEIKQILERLHLNNRSEAIAYAARSGLSVVKVERIEQ